MIIKVLMENTSQDPALHAEHGLSLYVESKAHKIICDTGASNLTWENAAAMGVDLSAVDALILTHGHYDHAGGIPGFAKVNADAKIYMKHQCLGDYYHGDSYIGIDKGIASLPKLCTVYGNSLIDADVSLLTRFPRRYPIPSGNHALLMKTADGSLVQDTFDHEQALVVRENGRFALFAGCAHNGILNIANKFREVYGVMPNAVISGFHMMKDTPYTDEEIAAIKHTAELLKSDFSRSTFYTGHCTGQPAFDIMKPILGNQLQSLHAGTVLHLFENEDFFKPSSLDSLYKQDK